MASEPTTIDPPVESEGSPKVIVTIQFCGAYTKYAKTLAEVLIGEFGEEAIDVQLNMDQGRTGNFEVVLVNSGDLIHSKSSGGGGRCESSGEQQAVIDKISAWIDEQ